MVGVEKEVVFEVFEFLLDFIRLVNIGLKRLYSYELIKGLWCRFRFGCNEDI